MKGKLIDGVLEYAPTVAIYQNIKYNPVPDEILIELGYKNIVFTPEPEPVDGMENVSSWEEIDDEIVQTWSAVPLPPKDYPDDNEIISALLKLLKGQTEELPDEEAQEVPELFVTWSSLIGKEATLGLRVYDDKKLWKCVQPHTIQEEWRPEITPALWTRVFVDEWPEWVQPTGAQDAYRIDAKTSHSNKHWINEVDYNTYEPGVYGWIEQ